MKKVSRGDIFYANLDMSVGSEQKGFRPCVVLQNDIGNNFSTTTIIVPISTKGGNKYLPTHVEIKTLGKIRKNSYAMAEQIRTIDKSRLFSFVCMLTNEEMKRIEEAVKIALEIK